METVLQGKSSTVRIGPELPTVIIGERINPTGKKKLAEALSTGDLSLVQEMAQAQVEAGAAVLDVNVGAAGVDEVALLPRAVEAVFEVVDVPVCVDTPNPEALAAALAICPGKPLVNSVNGEEEKLEAVLPLVAERGAAVIGLLMGDDGIPHTPQQRLAVAHKIRDRAAALGIPAEDIVFDPLMLAVGAEPLAGQVGLETIRLLRAELDANITVGASNVSFGMPDRGLLNRTFMAMAIACGVNCPISHPAHLCDTILAADVLLGKDEFGMRYIKACRAKKELSVRKKDIEMSQRVVKADAKAGPAAAPGGLFDLPKPTADVTRPWDDDPVGFAVVGLGMGHIRSKEITQTPGVRLVGVCDLIEERAQRTSEMCKVPYSTDVQRWLEDDEVEVVFVLTETGRHVKVALQALGAGKHVLSTKPMDATLDACDQMISLAEEKGLLLGVDFSRRYRPDVQTLKAAVAEGHFGRLLGGNCSLKVLRTMEYFQSNGGWRGTRCWDGGGVFSNQAIHHIDEVAYTVGIPAKVRCSIWTQNHDIEAEDLGTAVWLYDDGSVITLYATTSYPHETWYLHYELEGTERAYAHVAGGPFEEPQIRWYSDGAWSNQAPRTVECKWLNSMDNFAAALRTGAELVCSGRDARRTQAILDAMYRSAYEAAGDWVNVKPELT